MVLHMKKQKYSVSLGMIVPLNFEIEIYATSKAEAIKKAIDTYWEGDYSNSVFTDPDFVMAKLDLGDNNSAIYVDEIEENQN